MFTFCMLQFPHCRPHKLFWDGHMSVNTSVSHKNFGKHVASEITSISLLPLSPIHHSNVLPRPFENVQTVDFCLMSNSNSTFCNQLYAGESEYHQEFIPGDSWFVFIWLVYISTFKRGKYRSEFQSLKNTAT